MDTDPFSFDLCVFGCGPGGFAGAMRALDAGKKVCIIESGEIGGTGVKWGALASKTMWELAKDFAVAGKSDRGYRATGLTVDFDAVLDTVHRAVKEKQYQMRSQIETFSPSSQGESEGSLTLEKGVGSFLSNEKAVVCYPDGKTREISAKNFLVATGSRPRHLPGIEVDQSAVIDSDGILSLRDFPGRLMIIGAGIIGCEYATIFSNFGRTEVWLIDSRERILPFEDPDISLFVDGNLKSSGVHIIHSASLRNITRVRDGLEVILDFCDGHSQVLEVDTVLLSVGRTPDFSRLAIDRVGIFPNPGGHLDIDENCRVKDNIYAAGDVTNHPALVNMAEMEARYAVKAMFGLARNPLSYRNMSTVMFFYPAVAAVGMNETACRRKNIPYRVATYANTMVNRAITMRALNGFVKIIVGDDNKGKILGMRAAGPHVSSTVMSVAFFMDQGKGIADALNSVYPHPTISEGIQECLRLFLGKSIYKPRAFPERISLRRWSPEKGCVDL